MNRLEAMEVFLSVVDAGSLSAAGRTLGMPLATVSRKVSELERHLKVKLLHRSTRLLTLTEAGQAYVNACKRILEDVTEAERAAMGEYSAPRGELLITAPIVFGRLHVLPVINEFLKAYPEVNVRLMLGDRIANLQEDHIDLAVRIGKLPDSSMVSTGVGMVRRIICASPAYFAQHGLPKEPAELGTHACVTFELANASAWNFKVGGAEVNVPIQARLTVNTAEAAIDAAISGIGITRVLSYQAEAARQAGLLEIALQDFEPAPMPVSLVYAERGRLLLKLRAFLDFAAPQLRKRLN